MTARPALLGRLPTRLLEPADLLRASGELLSPAGIDAEGLDVQPAGRGPRLVRPAAQGAATEDAVLTAAATGRCARVSRPVAVAAAPLPSSPWKSSATRHRTNDDVDAALNNVRGALGRSRAQSLAHDLGRSDSHDEPGRFTPRWDNHKPAREAAARTVDQVWEVIAMSEPTASPAAVDRASAAFWSPTDLNTLLTGAEPLREDESFAIPDLTDTEWEAFSRALNE
jgi:hypothetical protein